MLLIIGKFFKLVIYFVGDNNVSNGMVVIKVVYSVIVFVEIRLKCVVMVINGSNSNVILEKVLRVFLFNIEFNE